MQRLRKWERQIREVDMVYSYSRITLKTLCSTDYCWTFVGDVPLTKYLKCKKMQSKDIKLKHIF